MFASTIARLRGASAYRKVFAVLLAGCVASFVLGQAAGHQPRGIRVAVANPARTAAIIAGALSRPVVAPPHVIVPLSVSHSHEGGDGNDGGHDGDSHDVPHAMPLPNPGHGDNPHQGGSPMPPIPALQDG